MFQEFLQKTGSQISYSFSSSSQNLKVPNATRTTKNYFCLPSSLTPSAPNQNKQNLLTFPVVHGLKYPSAWQTQNQHQLISICNKHLYSSFEEYEEYGEFQEYEGQKMQYRETLEINGNSAHVQWNPAITKCHGTEKNVRYSGVFVIVKTPL